MDIYYSTYAHINYTLRIGLCGLPYVFLELLFKIKKLLYVKQLSCHGWPFIDLLYVTLCSLALCSCIFKIIFLNIGELILNFYYLNNLASMVYIQVHLHACVWQSVFSLFFLVSEDTGAKANKYLSITDKNIMKNQLYESWWKAFQSRQLMKTIMICESKLRPLLMLFAL